ncbi:MAG: NlpC/P60 family protein [Pseudomonadota bacterium]
MSDPRTSPDPDLVQGAKPARIVATVCDLTRTPFGPRDRQLIAGDPVTILGTEGRRHYVRSEKDGYIGWLMQSDTGPYHEPTHVVTALATHAYTAPDFKSPERVSLTFGSRLFALSATEGYIETPYGFVPSQHLAALPWTASQPAQVAQLFLGTPYLWGGNSRLGLDCSGLVQAALLACGIPCPGDSDQQQAALPAIEQADQPGDLIFWKGHVAMLLDAHTLIHANAYHMAVATEPKDTAIARIAKKEFGDITGFARPSLGSKYPGEFEGQSPSPK